MSTQVRITEFARGARCLATLLAVFLCAPLAHAQTITTFDGPVVGYTVANDISADGLVTGYFCDPYVNCPGYIRDTAGVMTTFVLSGLVIMIPAGVTPSGVVVGFYYYPPDYSINHGFVRDASGTITTFDAPGASNTVVYGMNESGAVTGFFTDGTGNHGYIRDATDTVTPFDPAGSTGTFALAINSDGAVTGYYTDASGTHGFVRDALGVTVSFDVPGSTSTSGYSINASGTVAGNYADASGTHAFIRDAAGALTTFDPAGSAYTTSSRINLDGSIAGVWADATDLASGNFHAFVRDPDGVITSFDVPGSSATFASSINDTGVITGTYYTGPYYSGGAPHGFIRSATAVITWDNPADIPYGAALSGTQLNATANVPGTFTYTPPLGTVLSLGTGQVLSVTFTPDDTTNYSGASTDVSINVVQASTSTAVGSSQNPSVYGQEITLTATVSPVAPGAGTPSGSVQFFENGAALGTQPLVAGVASLDVSTLPSGDHPITATYAGDGNFTGSASAVFVQTVGKAPTATSLVGSANPSRFGQSIDFTATVTDGAKTPTGRVEFLDGPISLGSVVLKNGVAVLSSSSLAVGSHSITAQYVETRNYLGSGSSALTHAVTTSDTTTALISSAKNNTSQFGKKVTFTATISTVAPGGGTPSGTVQFYDGATALGAPQVVTHGQVQVSVSSLSRGAHSITAVYAGDGGFNASTSAVLVQQVN